MPYFCFQMIDSTTFFCILQYMMKCMKYWKFWSFNDEVHVRQYKLHKHGIYDKQNKIRSTTNGIYESEAVWEK